MPDTWLTEAETEAIQHLPRGTPYLIRDPVTDELIRDDVLRFVARMRRKAKSAAKAAGVDEEGGLF